MSKLVEKIKLKRKTLQIYGTLEKYEAFSRWKGASASLYSDDYDRYNDTVQERHQRNIKDIKQLIEALQKKVITPDMLEFNTSNTFYPSYILNHHCNHFSKLVSKLAEDEIALRPHMKKYAQFKEIGAIFEKIVNVDFKK